MKKDSSAWGNLFLWAMYINEESFERAPVPFANGYQIVKRIFDREQMLCSVMFIKKTYSLKLAQVSSRILQRELEAFGKKPYTHIYVRNFVLVKHIMNIIKTDT